MPASSIAGSPLLRVAFITLALLLAGAFIAALRAAALRSGEASAAARRRVTGAALLVTAWLAVTAGAAAAGILHFEAPPTMLAIFPAILLVVIAVTRSTTGAHLAHALPLSILVGFQGFRIFVELLMHRAYTEGLMPVQMSYSGRNFDIVSGITAIALAGWLATGRRSIALVFAWNTLGLALLANIVTIALLSAPTPWRVFMNEPADVWITRAPWIWLPTVMVLMALLGHVLVYRRLASEVRSRAAAPGVSPA